MGFGAGPEVLADSVNTINRPGPSQTRTRNLVRHVHDVRGVEGARRAVRTSAQSRFAGSVTGDPAAFHALKPPSMWATCSAPMSTRAAVARAERQPDWQ